MKRLLGLLLVMGMVGCGTTVDSSKLVRRGGLTYEGDGETPFTGVARSKYENWQKMREVTYKDGKQEGLETTWHENGQKMSEVTYKDGKLEGLETSWHANGQKQSEMTYKDGKEEGLLTAWHANGQKAIEATYKDGKKVSATKWDKEGNARFYDDHWNEIKK